MTLTEFLLARIAEDEQRADDVYLDLGVTSVRDGIDLDVYMPQRIRRECEAKRRIVGQWNADAYINEDGEVLGGQGPETHHETLCLLAAVYSDHPDYREEWKP